MKQINQRGWILLLLAGGLLLSFLLALVQTGPGYMDAEYYTAGGLNLFDGHFGEEYYIWNYLAGLHSLPVPAFAYWMPLPAILAGLGMLLTGSRTFAAARLIYSLGFALLPVCVYCLARRTPAVRLAGLAGLLALFPGVYIIYLTLPEAFLIYLYAGLAFLAVTIRYTKLPVSKRSSAGAGVLLGLIAGCMHLSRADGLLWLAAGLLWVGIIWVKSKVTNLRIAIMALLGVISGYGMVMGAWFYRNLAVFGSLMPPGGSMTIWMSNYNQTYSVDLSAMTLQSWLQTPLSDHFNAWGSALGLNLANLLIFQGGIILLPFMVIGVIRWWKFIWVKFFTGMGLLTLLVMTVVFPFSGSRGGFIHSGSALQVFAWLMVLPGLEGFAEWLKRKRGLPVVTSQTVFSVFLTLAMAGISFWAVSNRVIGTNVDEPMWTESERQMQAVGAYLNNNQQKDTVAMVNNPPGFYYVNNIAAVVIPYESLDTVISTARELHVQYLIVDENQVNLQDQYLYPEDWPGLTYLTTVAEARIYQVKYE
jgi:flagellar basal body-associated protein FliL